MECRYCNQCANSSAKSDQQVFCRTQQKMVRYYDENCENFELASNFWCVNTGCWIDIKMCTNRQSNPAMTRYYESDCKKCNQKKDVIEIRRFVGRLAILAKNQEVQSQPKKILIRREANA